MYTYYLHDIRLGTVYNMVYIGIHFFVTLWCNFQNIQRSTSKAPAVHVAAEVEMAAEACCLTSVTARSTNMGI